MKLEIYGASDDLIEVDGDICEEFNALGDSFEGGGDGGLLAFSDGTILKVIYGDEGIWRISPIVHGLADYSINQGTDMDDDYTDRVTLTGEFAWVVYGSEYARP